MTSGEKYRVIQKLDAGGMAEVFIGEAETLQGFKKRVAIKRVLPHLVENRKFLAMFLDEARLSLRFNHANVVQTFDIGRSGNTYFIVMEYVDGTNLKTVNELLRKREERLPMELAVFIVIEVCRGLAYAHELRDNDGKLLGIVHRDVSPPNILLSKQGEVKIVDFGLAKATSQLENTDPGVVKGKFAYLSPEVAHGKQATSRADIFALGIILWELLTGERLFLGENDIQTVELVRRGRVPTITTINGLVPTELDGIVRKALAYDPEDRFATCDDLAEALAGFLFGHGLKVTSFDLQRLVKRMVSEDDGKRKVRPSIIDQLIQEEMVRFSSLDEEDYAASAARDSFGSMPLDPTGFHDTPVPPSMGRQGWREAGRETDGDRRAPRPAPAPQQDLGGVEPPSLAQMLEGEVRLGSAPVEAEVKSRAVLVAIIAGTTVLVAGALLAYFLGLIP